MNSQALPDTHQIQIRTSEGRPSSLSVFTVPLGDPDPLSVLTTIATTLKPLDFTDEKMEA